jgi:cell pole-organizing protein PopZ
MSAAKATAPALPVDDKRRAHEPSMEEILASIRRIITDDQNARRGERQQDALSEPEETHYDAEPTIEAPHGLSLEPSSEPDIRLGVEPADADSPEDRRDNFLRHLKASSEAQSRGAFRQAAEILEAAEREIVRFDPPQAHMRAAPGAPAIAPDGDELSPLVSDATAATIAAQFESLAASRLFSVDGRMEDLVNELLRPMLQEWLDNNLPSIVEKLVRAEIERVARGRRS